MFVSFDSAAVFIASALAIMYLVPDEVLAGMISDVLPVLVDPAAREGICLLPK